MPTRMIKESIWTSPNLNELSDLAERHFYRILPLPDDFGCCEVTAVVVKGRCYPRKPQVSETDIEGWQQELEDKGLIIRWAENGREFAIFPSFGKHQRIRSLHQRKTPAPPDDVMSRVDGSCRQMTANDRLNPIPIPNPILNHNPDPNHTPLNPPTVCPSLESVINAYQDNILVGGTVTEQMEAELKGACRRYTPAWVADAIKEAVCQNQPTWRYIMGILQNWQGEGKGAR